MPRNGGEGRAGRGAFSIEPGLPHIAVNGRKGDGDLGAIHTAHIERFGGLEPVFEDAADGDAEFGVGVYIHLSAATIGPLFPAGPEIRRQLIDALFPDAEMSGKTGRFGRDLFGIAAPFYRFPDLHHGVFTKHASRH